MSMMLRRLHTYLSIASAPIILFFCLTGCLQLFDWHEPRGAYHPPSLIEKLGMLHKKQRFDVRGGGHGGPGRPAEAPPPGAARPATAAAPAASGRPERGGAERGPSAGGVRVLLLRWLFLLATVSLVASTLMGAWIGITHVKRKRLCWLLLCAGALLPVLIVAL